MIVVSTETIQGKSISETMGIAKGSTVRARHLGRDAQRSWPMAQL